MPMRKSSSTSSFGGKQSLTSASKQSAKSDTVNYLLLYEAMVRHQDLEYDATHDHIALTVARIRYLGRKSAMTSGGGSVSGRSVNAPALVDEEDAPGGMLTYLQMRRCLLRLGYTWNRSLASTGAGMSVSSNSVLPQDSYYDDDVSVMSSNSASTFISGGGHSNASSTMMAHARDIIATDAQLIMLLTTLVEMEERHRAVKMAEAENAEDENEASEVAFGQGLYLPEFIQAYKLIIGGMQSLQTYPNPADNDIALQKSCAALGMPVDKASLQDVRVRSRERTLGLLSLFGPDTTLYSDGGAAQQSAGEASAARKTRDGLKSKNRAGKAAKAVSRTTSGKKQATMMAKDGLLPRLTEEEIRTMVHSKDKALAKILEDHESEMHLMANNMEELRLKGLKTQALLKRRKKRTRIGVVVGFLLLCVGGGIYEYYKQEQVKIEIATGREAERQADDETMKALNKQIKSLTSKLNDAEATIRYEESRYDSIKSKYESSTKALAESEKKWIVDQRDLESCLVTRKELDAELTLVKTKNEETEEEVSWCRERLANVERELFNMERKLKKKGKEVVKEVEAETNKVDDAAIDARGLPAPTESESEKALGYKKGSSKPVKMEMKYNKSFRDAVILRQVYSAAGGMVVSLVANALFPGLSKVIRLLFKR